jgi:hypothetical protein
MQTSNLRRVMGVPAHDADPTGRGSQQREAGLNWLALGLLLAAWNAVDDGSGSAQRRPQALRGYSYVSVRAMRTATMDPRPMP